MFVLVVGSIIIGFVVFATGYLLGDSPSVKAKYLKKSGYNSKYNQGHVNHIVHDAPDLIDDIHH